jgi:hypothetical protein
MGTNEPLVALSAALACVSCDAIWLGPRTSRMFAAWALRKISDQPAPDWIPLDGEERQARP